MKPLIQPVMNAVKSWASFGVSEGQAEPVGNPFKKKALPFDEAYPRLTDHIKFNEHQRADLLPRLGFTSVSTSEVDLALSRTPADTNFADVANFVSGVIRHFRSENPEDPDTAAARKLMEISPALAVIDAQLQEAKSAEQRALAQHQAFERAYYEHRSIPGQHEHLVAKIAGLELQAKQIQEADYDAQIMQHLTLQYNPKPGVMIAGSIGELVVARETRELKLRVIADVLEQCRTALSKLAEDNKRLSKELDLKEHQL